MPIFFKRLNLRAITLLQNRFVRSVSVLSSATAFAQLIFLAAMPVLSRLYTPEDFGVYAIFAALLGIIGVAASLRYQVAIPLPKTDSLAFNLVALSLTIVLLTTSLTLLVVTFLGDRLVLLLTAPEFKKYLLMLPIGVLTIGSYNVFLFWATRKKEFDQVAKTRLEQALGGVGTQIGLGILSVGPAGLIIGQLISQSAGILGLIRRTCGRSGKYLSRIKPRRMVIAATAYSKYPKYSTIEALANTGSIQIPLLLLAGLVGNAELGFLILAMRIMQAPMSLVGTAVSQVYYAQAVVEHRDGRLPEFTSRIVEGLIKFGVGPLIFFGLVAPSIFGLVFGEQWQRAGVLVAWMTPWFVLQFVTSPVSMAFHVTSNQKRAVVLQLVGLVLRVSAVLVIATLAADRFAVEAFAVSGAVFYLIYLLAIKKAVDVPARLLVSRIGSALLYAIPWVLLGLTIIFFKSDIWTSLI